jgi:hypothetical protein
MTTPEQGPPQGQIEKPKKPKPKPKPPKYTYVLSPVGVNCHAGKGGQTVGKLHVAKTLSSFHDAELAQATREINQVLDRVERNNKDPKRELSFIEFQDQPFLVWATYDAVGPEDDDDVIARALGLE